MAPSRSENSGPHTGHQLAKRARTTTRPRYCRREWETPPRSSREKSTPRPTSPSRTSAVLPQGMGDAAEVLEGEVGRGVAHVQVVRVGLAGGADQDLRLVGIVGVEAQEAAVVARLEVVVADGHGVLLAGR